MSQIEIAQIIEQIKSEIEVDEFGQAKASVRATARLAGVDHTAIINHLQGGELKPTKLAQTIISQGFEAGELTMWRNLGIPDVAIAIILEYYAYDAGRYSTKQARLICRSFNTIGIRAWIQDKLGWIKPAAPTEPAMTQIQLLAAIAQQMALQEQRLLEQEQQQTEILVRIAAVEVEQDRFNSPCGHKYSIVGFAKLQGLEISLAEAGGKGKKASALCRKKGIKVEHIRDPRFGQVGLYPESILVEVFKAEQK
ncbi:hypothetical protein WKK05_13180 [Nostoc sp. UHCC 0302]|uniref:hypothetical protein n=1 Tax=Nostoc sp. UHCC 0302 TaxID=3134896 RepID=UPI00311CC927